MTQAKTKPFPAKIPIPSPEEVTAAQVAIGARIRKRREALKLTQVDASAVCGWSPSTWADTERGRFCPNLKTLMIVAKVLGWTVSGLLRI